MHPTGIDDGFEAGNASLEMLPPDDLKVVELANPSLRQTPNMAPDLRFPSSRGRDLNP
jgi:hypothetical protein